MNRFNSALMCANKHLINAFVEDHPDQSKPYCPHCGKEIFSRCLGCQSPIQGGSFAGRVTNVFYNFTADDVANFCPNCGKPYPWVDAEVKSTVAVDRHFGEMAIEEAKKSVPEDERPHPKVGAVVVKNGLVLSKAHRGEVLKSHAEYIALDDKLFDDVVAGATFHTTLEPCTTRTHPKIPCAQRLVDLKIA